MKIVEFTTPAAEAIDINEPRQHQPNQAPRRKYVWPWFLLAGLILGIVLAFLWLSYEVQRTRRYRDLNAPLQQEPPAPG